MARASRTVADLSFRARRAECAAFDPGIGLGTDLHTRRGLRPVCGDARDWDTHGWRAGQALCGDPRRGPAAPYRGVACKRRAATSDSTVGNVAAGAPDTRELHHTALGDESACLNDPRVSRRRRTRPGDIQQHPTLLLFAHSRTYRRHLYIGNHN